MSQAPVLDTSAGEFPLREYRFQQWSIRHAGAVLTEADETHAIVLKTRRLPHGASPWPSAIPLAHEIATRP